MLMVYHLHVYLLANAEIHVQHTCSKELLGKHRNIELIGIEAGYVAVLEHLRHLLGNVFEQRLVLHVLVVNAVHSGRALWYMASGVHSHRLAFLFAIWINLNVRKLYDTILCRIGASGLQIEEH